MRATTPLALAAFLALLLAGCMEGQDGTTSTGTTGPREAEQEPDWAVRAIFGDDDPDATERLPDHDHANRTLHTGLSTPNMEIMGFAPVSSSYYDGAPPGSSFCGDVSAPGERQLALVHSHLSDVAFSVVDISDRSSPQFLGELVLPFVFTYDVSIFGDGRYAVVAANPDLAFDKAPSAGGFALKAYWRTPCGTEEANSTVDYIPYGYSTLLVDLADPTAPSVVDFYPYANGRNVHSISTATIDGTRYVATSGLQAIPCTIPGVPGNPVPNPPPCNPAVPRYGNLLSHYDFLTVEETATGAKLRPYGVYVADVTREFDPTLLALSNGHTDATLQKHPKTNETIGYLANWDGGFMTVRLDGPGQATLLATWGQADPAAGGDPTQMTGNIHTARPVEGLQNGRHLTVTGQEIVGRPANRPTGQIVILDTTNPADPKPVARWTIPVNFTWPPDWGLRFSTHYAILQDDVLFVAAYHTGVWAADARESQWPELPTLGVLIPDRMPHATPRVLSDTPEVLEVLDNGDGTLTAFDADSGAYVFRFNRDDGSVPPALPWTRDAWIGR